jgi:hypothetical protein
MVTLMRRVDRPDSVYRYIEDWESVASKHGKGIHYLFLYGVFQWGPNRDQPVKAFAIVMQYSDTIGKDVDLGQPAHVLAQDVSVVLPAFTEFVRRLSG